MSAFIFCMLVVTPSLFDLVEVRAKWQEAFLGMLSTSRLLSIATTISWGIRCLYRQGLCPAPPLSPAASSVCASERKQATSNVLTNSLQDAKVSLEQAHSRTISCNNIYIYTTDRSDYYNNSAQNAARQIAHNKATR
jgi:hypothetical protein